jgi:ribosomal protein S8
MSGNHPRFSEFADEKPQLEGEKKKIIDVLNTEILITDYRIASSKYKEKRYLTLQYKAKGGLNIIFTGSEVLMDQARKYEDQMPFFVTIVQRGKYYTMT